MADHTVTCGETEDGFPLSLTFPAPPKQASRPSATVPVCRGSSPRPSHQPAALLEERAEGRNLAGTTSARGHGR